MDKSGGGRGKAHHIETFIQDWTLDKLTKGLAKNGRYSIMLGQAHYQSPMETIMLESAVARFNTFRDRLHASFPKRRDALLELVDALAGNTSAKSPVALSLSPLFSRCYGSLHDAVDNFFSCHNYCKSHQRP